MNGQAGFDPSVASMLWTTAERVPDKVAVTEPGSTVTWSRLAGRAGAVAARLEDLGLDPGDRVVAILEQGADSVATYFGTLAAGGIAVTLNALLRPRQIEYVLGHSGARVLVTSRELETRLHRALDSDATVIAVEDLMEAAPAAWAPLTPTGPAQITYTSGSTGMPKGVVASHANVWAAIDTVVRYLGLGEHDRIAGLLPFSGVYGANQMLCATLTGATLVVARSPLMNRVATELRDGEATVLAAVPPLWQRLVEAPAFADEPIPTLRILQNAGGHLPPAVVKRLRGIQPQARIFLQYGMTEVFRSTFLPPEDVDERPECMGRAMPGTEILNVRPDDTVCDPGEVGELVHSGPTVALGYWNDPERTARTFRPHPVSGNGVRAVYSGDLVRRDEDGYFYFVGRADRMIKTLGYRVGPEEVLDVLHASGAIADGVVTGVDDPDRGQRIVACVVLREGASVADVHRFCKVELPRFMQPSEILEFDELPRSPNGKHDVIALREFLEAR